MANAFCNKCGYYGPETAGGVHRRPSDGEWCNYVCAPAALVSPEIAAERARILAAERARILAAERARILAALDGEAEKYPGTDWELHLRAVQFFLETEVFP